MKYVHCLWIVLCVAGCMVRQESAEPTASAPSEDAVVEGSTTTETAEADAEAAGETTEELIIDVRSEEEWESGHLSQAIHIPHTEIADKIHQHTTDKNAKIVLYCAVGGRAGKAKDTLEEMGFVNVENAGGYDDVKERYAAP